MIDWLDNDALTARAAEWEGTVAVIMPARDEGPLAVQTIRDLRRRRAPGTHLVFCVIDDGSRDGCCKILEHARDVCFLRNEPPLGQGVARSLAEVAFSIRPDLYLSIDAHINMPNEFDVEKLAICAQQTNGIVLPICGDANKPKQRTPRAGHKWSFGFRPGDELPPHHYGKPPLVRTWDYARGPDVPLIKRVAIPQGACYAYTPATLERMGGHGESRAPYGFFDSDMAIRARYLDIPIHVLTSALSQHMFRRARPYPQDVLDGGYWHGYIESLRSTVQPETWEAVFRPALRPVLDKLDNMHRYLLHTPRLAVEQEGFELRKRRTDRDLCEWIGIPGAMLPPEAQTLPERATVVTPVYAPTSQLAALVRRCMRATADEFPQDRRIMAVDMAPEGLIDAARRDGWEILTLDGKPGGRLRELLQAAVTACDTEIMWTIEHDAEILPGRRDAMTAMLQRHPGLAGLEAPSVNRYGVPNYPSSRKRFDPHTGSYTLRRVRPHLSLNCTAWRTAALKALPWDRVAPFPACDKSISHALLRAGHDLADWPEQTCVHYHAGARRLLESKP